MQPILSIIIPFYNVEQYIAQCLDSVYRQDIPEEEYEVICVDDCSPDNSIAIVEEYAKKHDNLVIVRNQYNRKLGGARNAGMEVANGKYIWFIDSDDFIEENCFKKLLSIAENEDLEMLHFNYAEYPNVMLPERRPDDTDVMTGTDMFFDSRFIWYHDLITAWRKLYKREFLIDNNIQFAEHIMFEDNDYAIIAFAKAKRVKHISTSMYYYRNNPESITRVKYTSEHIGYWLDLCHRLIRIKNMFIREKNDERFLVLIATWIRYHISNSINIYLQMDDMFERKKIYNTIRKNVTSELKPYMSRLKYYKLRIGIL